LSSTSGRDSIFSCSGFKADFWKRKICKNCGRNFTDHVPIETPSDLPKKVKKEKKDKKDKKKKRGSETVIMETILLFYLAIYTGIYRKC
jgi:hypothetical protein